MNTVLILVCGLPGSGKSFFAQQLSKKIDAAYYNSDLVRKELFPKYRTYSEKEKQDVYDTIIVQAAQALQQKKSVIVDATFYKNALRIPFYALAETNKIPVYIFYITAAEALIKERTSKTRPDSEADFTVYLKLKDSFEPIDKPFNTLISTDHNIDVLLSNALTYLQHGEKRD